MSVRRLVPTERMNGSDAVDRYPVIEVDAAERRPEDMGSKSKFWYTRQDDGAQWLFKHPRPNSGEHWAEKIAEQVAVLLEIPHGEVELAVFGETRGSSTKSFVGDEEELVHGNQILERTEAGYDADKIFRQSSHTLHSVMRGMDSVFVSPEDAEGAKRRFAEYAALDALIGNTDRHHENWGVVRRRAGSGWVGSLAPSYDHASSLGRELTDERRDARLKSGGVGGYLKRARGGIYWEQDDRRAPSPLRLAMLATERYPDMFVPALRNLERLSESAIVRIVNRIPDDWMSESARRFAVSIMRYNIAKLQEVVR